jgi:hypothetical protein
MSDVGVKRFTAGDCQKRRPEHDESDARVLQQESQRVGRIDCGKNVRPVQNAANAEHRNVANQTSMTGVFITELRYTETSSRFTQAMDIPVRDMAKASALYYHRYLLEHENENSPYTPGLGCCDLVRAASEGAVGACHTAPRSSKPVLL